jgi:hypothetical protein
VHLRIFIAACLLGLVAAIGAAQEKPEGHAGWTFVERERGITLSRREQPNCGLPAFRGEGHLHGSVLQILSVMLDMSVLHRWAYGVDEARVVRRIDERTELLYLYSDLPWPVRDRDMVVRKQVEVLKPGTEFRISLTCEPKAQAEREAVIRVQHCRSSFLVRKVNAETTALDYAMSLDPAGLLPKWAGSYVAKHVPFNTLVALEERAAESHGKYQAEIRRWSAAM